MIKLFYTTTTSVDLAQHGLYRAKVGKSGISANCTMIPFDYMIFAGGKYEQPLQFTSSSHFIKIICISSIELL